MRAQIALEYLLVAAGLMVFLSALLPVTNSVLNKSVEAVKNARERSLEASFTSFLDYCSLTGSGSFIQDDFSFTRGFVLPARAEYSGEFVGLKKVFCRNEKGRLLVEAH
ncbi:MAG: hypothetical protein ABH803_02165 [Candidatus Micrarchaeota archaeon]